LARGHRHQRPLSARQRAAWLTGIALVAGLLSAVPFRWYERIVMAIAVMTFIAIPAVLLLALGRSALTRREKGGG
jgi:cell division protein FtsW (lipid II flippase)